MSDDISSVSQPEGKSEDQQTQLAQKLYTKGVTWGPWTAIVVALLVYIVAQVVAIQIADIYPILRHWSSAQADAWLTSSIFAQFFYVLLAETFTIGFLVWFIRFRKGNFRVIGLTRPKLEDIAYGLSGLLIYFPIYFGSVIALNLIFPHLNVSQAQNVGFSGTYAGYQLGLVFASLVLLPPIAEEIMFRGFLFSGLKKALPLLWAAVATSLIFAIPHLFESSGGGLLWIAGIDTFVLSLVLCWLRQKTGRLYASITLHALKNCIAFFVIYIAPHIPSHGLFHS